MDEPHFSTNKIIPVIFGFMLLNNLNMTYILYGLLFFNSINFLNNKYKITEKINNLVDDIELSENHSSILWEILHGYSKVSIAYKKHVFTPLTKYVITPFSNMINGTALDIDRIIFVNNGRPILKFKTKTSMYNFFRLSKKKGLPVVYEYDFILFYPKNQNTMILDNINDIPDINQVENNQVKSKVGFMACQLIINHSSGDIKKHLSLDEFMVNGNEILSKEFVLWYCKTYFKDEFVNIEELDTYTIHLLDNNVNEIKLTQNDSIKIYEKDYKIITYEDEDDDEDEEKENTKLSPKSSIECNETEKSEEKEELIELIEKPLINPEPTINNETIISNSLENTTINHETPAESSGFWEITKLNFKYFNGGVVN